MHRHAFIPDQLVVMTNVEAVLVELGQLNSSQEAVNMGLNGTQQRPKVGPSAIFALDHFGHRVQQLRFVKVCFGFSAAVEEILRKLTILTIFELLCARRA